MRILRGLVIVGIVLIACTILNNQYQDAINDCVSGGNSVEFCQNGLR